VEFLVNIEVGWPPDGDPDELARLTNWGIWEAADATAVHAAIRSLPLFPWLDVDVIPLAAHPNDPERPGGA
jgi:muconolactone D-isomerase